jgi:hypothetical protein
MRRATDMRKTESKYRFFRTTIFLANAALLRSWFDRLTTNGWRERTAHPEPVEG